MGKGSVTETMTDHQLNGDCHKTCNSSFPAASDAQELLLVTKGGCLDRGGTWFGGQVTIWIDETLDQLVATIGTFAGGDGGCLRQGLQMAVSCCSSWATAAEQRWRSCQW